MEPPPLRRGAFVALGDSLHIITLHFFIVNGFFKKVMHKLIFIFNALAGSRSCVFSFIDQTLPSQ